MDDIAWFEQVGFFYRFTMDLNATSGDDMMKKASRIGKLLRKPDIYPFSRACVGEFHPVFGV